jgi:membrane-associated phospholipid phosphatase
VSLALKACRTFRVESRFPSPIPMIRSRDIAWTRDLGARIKSHWQFKGVGIVSFFAIFFLGYFVLLKNPQFPVTIMPLIGADQWIGFHPWTLAFYVSLWLYVQFAPAAISDKRELISFGWGAAGLMIVGFTIFFFWPTCTPRAEIDWEQYSQFSFLKTIDASGNACPSLHVAFAIFFAVWNHRLLRDLRSHGVAFFLNAVWCAGIIFSTVATKQHVVLDVLAGTALGAIAVTAHLYALGADEPAS